MQGCGRQPLLSENLGIYVTIGTAIAAIPDATASSILSFVRPTPLTARKLPATN